MPVPFLLAGAAVLAGAAGVAKGAKAISNNTEAKEMVSKAQLLYDEAKGKLEKQRQDTTECLENLGKVKLDAWANEMNSFLNIFHSFKNISVGKDIDVKESIKLKMSNPESLKNMGVAAAKASEITQAGIASLGAGALAGIASYGGAMMFASASTGTAIASLSGVAATNATLAWFGGGALSVGGLGMAGGTFVLGGIVAGPVLAVAGFLMAAKSEENLANARKTYAEAENAAEKMDTMVDFMKSVSIISDDYSGFVISFQKKFQLILQELSEIRNRAYKRQAQIKRGTFGKILRGNSNKIDFRLLSQKEQKILHLSWLMAQVFSDVLAAPLLSQNGDIDSNAKYILQDAEQELQEIERKKYIIEQMPDEEPVFDVSQQSHTEGQIQKKVSVEKRTK